MSYKRKDKTVLIVEDVEEIISQMRAMLHHRGHRILQAANAQEAIEIAERERPNMILTDLDLPTFDLLVRGVRGHKDLSNMLMAIMDINGPVLRAEDNLKVLANFNQLDALLDSAEA